MPCDALYGLRAVIERGSEWHCAWLPALTLVTGLVDCVLLNELTVKLMQMQRGC